LPNPASIPQASPLPRLGFSDAEAGQILGLSSRTVYSLRATGQLGFMQIGSRVVIPLRSIRLFIKENTKKSVARLAGS
jgi:hypothetical protein